jgi:hypothetical protein
MREERKEKEWTRPLSWLGGIDTDTVPVVGRGANAWKGEVGIRGVEGRWVRLRFAMVSSSLEGERWGEED